MRKNLCFRCFLLILIIISAVMPLAPAFAGTSTEGGSHQYEGDASLNAQLNALPPFKFEKHKNGIGYGSCPVYTAPSESAYRCANGRATCDTNSAMDDAGFVSGWLMVRYETNKGGCRVGFIPPKYVKGYKSSMYPHFGYIEATALDTIYVTDNPMVHGTSFAMLEAGETFHILSKYDYYKKNGLEWWYIECTVDGQLAYGFIELNGSQFSLGSSGDG